MFHLGNLVEENDTDKMFTNPDDPRTQDYIMQEKPASLYGSGLGSNYQAQGLKLSKHFRI